MNREYIVIDNIALISSENGELSLRKANDNLDEILVQENRIEFLEESLKSDQVKLLELNKKKDIYKSNLKTHMIFSIILSCLSPVLFSGVLSFVSLTVVSIIKCVPLGMAFFAFLGLGLLYEKFALKEIEQEIKGLEFKVSENSKDLAKENNKLKSKKQSGFLESSQVSDKYLVRVIDDKVICDELKHNLELQYYCGLNYKKLIEFKRKELLNEYLVLQGFTKVEDSKKIRQYLNSLSFEEKQIVVDEKSNPKSLIKSKKVF